MPAGGQRELGSPTDIEEGEHGGAETIGIVAVERLVEELQYVGRFRTPDGGRPDGVTGEGRHGGGVGAFSHDVAQHDSPAPVPELEHVIEIPTDIETLLAGVVDGGQLNPGNGGQARRQEAGL